jgi:hypothetical protein
MPLTKLTPKQRLTITIAIGLIIVLITFYMNPSEVVVIPPLPNKENTEIVKTSTKAVMPVGPQSNQVNRAIRDPFAIPPEYKEQTPTANNFKTQMGSIPPNISTNESTSIGQAITPAKTKDLLKLTGILSANNQYIAVIQVADKSKAYYLNELIGNYQLIAILKNSVILTNHDKQLILPLESAKPKGDNK